MKIKTLITTAVIALATPAAAQADLHANPGESWQRCGHVESYDVSVLEPATSCSFGRAIVKRAMYSQRTGRFSFRLKSPATHRTYRVTVDVEPGGSYMDFWVKGSGRYLVGGSAIIH